MRLSVPSRPAALVVAVLALAACTGPTDEPAPTRAVATPTGTPTAAPCAPAADGLRLDGEPEVGATVLLRSAVERYEEGQLVESSESAEQADPPVIVWSGDDPHLGVADLEASEQVRDALAERELWLTASDPGSPRDGMGIQDPGSTTFVFYRAADPLTVPVSVSCDGRTWTGVLHHWTRATDGAVDCGHDPDDLPASARLALEQCPA